MRWRDGFVEVGRRGTEMKAGRWAKAESGHVRRILKWIFYETICSHNFQIMNRDTISGQIQWLCVLFWVNMNRLSLTLLYLFRFAAERILPSYSSVSVCVCLCICRKEIPNTKQWHVYFVLLWDCHQWSVGRIFFVWVSFRTIEKSLFSYFLIKISW